MAKTWKELTNEVLKRLREDQMSDTQDIADDDYWELIASFVNDAKQEVEDAWTWTDLRTTLSDTTTSSDSELILVGSGPRVKIMSMWDTTNNAKINKMSHDYFNRNTLVADVQNAPPQYYRKRGVDSNDDTRVELYPIPNGTYTIRTYCIVPQADFTDDDTELELANVDRAIIYRAWDMAISERGEDGGKLSTEARLGYQKYLDNAISLDMQTTQNELDWIVV